MTLEAPMRCSAQAEELGEPMIGSVDVRRRWLLVEDRSHWGEKAVRDVLGSAFEDGAKARGLRPLLIRHREGPPEADALRRAFLIDTVTREIAIRTIGDPVELVLDELADAPIASFGDPASEPIFLVCTNGRRDACCALRGRALLAALDVENRPAAWECTHLGGHRFAANLVCLPDGIVYGRVLPADGPRLAAAYRTGRLDPEFLRGRSAWPAPAQVAEGELRRELGLAGVGDISLRSVEGGDEAAIVDLATVDGSVHRFDLVAERTEPPRAISCRAEELEEPLHWRVTASARVE